MQVTASKLNNHISHAKAIPDSQHGNGFGIWKYYVSLHSAKNMRKKRTTRLTAQTMHFFPITQSAERLSITINSCRCFLFGNLVLSRLILHIFNIILPDTQYFLSLKYKKYLLSATLTVIKYGDEWAAKRGLKG